MLLSELNGLRFAATKAASDQARPLALAGVGIVWLFAGPFFQQLDNSERPSGTLLLAACLFCVSLALDLLQLTVRALLLDAIYDDRENSKAAQEAIKDGSDPSVQEIGKSLKRVTITFWVLKLSALAAGYIAIVWFFIGRLLAI